MTLSLEVPFLCPPDFVPHAEKIFAGEYDVPLYGYGLTILDIGANCGAFAMWASHRWPGSKVYCYEPMPDNFTYLTKNMKHYRKNPDVGGESYLRNTAVRAKQDQRTMYRGLTNCGEASFFPELGEADRAKPVTVLTSPISELPPAHILKIDTEGCEVEILEAMMREEGHNFTAIMLEYHRTEDRRKIDQLLGKDYILFGAQVYSANRGIVKYLRDEV